MTTETNEDRCVVRPRSAVRWQDGESLAPMAVEQKRASAPARQPSTPAGRWWRYPDFAILLRRSVTRHPHQPLRASGRSRAKSRLSDVTASYFRSDTCHTPLAADS